MTHDEYAAYEKTVLENIPNEAIVNVREGDPDYGLRRECDGCRRATGKLYDCDVVFDDDVHDYKLCEDCVYFCTYGRLDDDTMFAVEEDRRRNRNG